MTNKTRRSFIAVAGAALSAPVAAAAATLPGRIEPDPLALRLARLEDVNEIRALNQAYLRHAADGARDAMAALFADPSHAAIDRHMCGVSPAGFGEHDVIEIAEDRQTATARVHVTVHTRTALDPDCTLVEMAQAQGEGVLRAALPAVLEHTYVRRGGVWKILRTRDSRAMA
jgi:hypothetical protein